MSRDDEDERDTIAEPRPKKVSKRPARKLDEDFAESLPTGTIAGRYVLLSRLGAGGAGLVYSAFDPQLDRKVAIKLLRGVGDGEHDSTRGRARLLREAQAMARLKHANILPVYDVGTLEHPLGSRVFMAMELVDGGTLRRWLRERHTQREILGVMLECGRGLAAAHAAGMVHRDFKPENVLLDRDGRVFVTDFGLVRAADTDPSDGPPIETRSRPSSLSNPLTAMGAVLGTPGYMAPEQYGAQSIDARTDQFSFCLTLCEALCGKRLVSGDSLEELEVATVSTDFATALHDAKVPTWLARVILTGLKPERDARYPSMNALLAALRRDPAQRRRRLLVGAVGAVAVLGAVMFGVHELRDRTVPPCGGAEQQLAGVWDPATRERVRQAFARVDPGARFDSVASALDTYARDFTRQHREACEATRVRGEQPESVLVLRMSCLDQRRKGLATLTSMLGDADRETTRDAMQLAAKLPSIQSCADLSALTAVIPPPDPMARELVAALRAKLAESKVLAGAARYPAARTIVEDVLRAETAVHYPPLRAEALQQLAGLQREQNGEMKAARATLLDAIYAAYGSRDDARVASATTDLAMLDAYWLGEHESGERWVQLAHAAIQRLGGSDELEAERGRIEAEIWIGEEKGAPAVAAAEPALRLAEKVYGATSLQAADFHATMGAAYSTDGNEQLSGQHYEAQRAILEKLVGPDHPLVAMAENNLGLNAESEGRLADAEKHYRTSVSILEQALGPDHPRVAIALSNLGAALHSDDKPAEALDVLQRALAINDKRFGTDYPDSLDALLGIGESLIALHRSAEAIPTIERALRMAESGEQNAWGVAEGRFALAEALWDTGRDRPRARLLAADARAKMAEVHNTLARKQLADIDAWIAQHR